MSAEEPRLTSTRLVITRNEGESIWIDGVVEVRVEAIEKRRARIVVVAPRDVVVRRTRDVALRVDK